MKEIYYDLIELGRAYLGLFLIVLFLIKTNQVVPMPGMFGNQVYIILQACSNPDNLMCPI